MPERNSFVWMIFYSLSNTHTHAKTYNRVLRPFSGTTRVSQC